MKASFLLPPLLILLAISESSCYRIRKSRGGGQITTVPARITNPADIALPPGYKAQVVAAGLTFPSALAFDHQGGAYVTETGYSYGEVWREPRLLRINNDGSTTPVATGTHNGPWTSVLYYKGAFYVSEGGVAEGGRILRVSPDGQMTPLVSNLPSMGDHHTNALVIKNGYIYFGQGTATNSGIVGPDNAEYGWLKRKPAFHDIPCRDITLAGQNYTTDNVLTDDPNDKATTGAYLPFGTPSTPGQVIRGKVPCSGAILRIPLEGGQPELVAWGFRNPYGLALGPEGAIYVTENAFDDRGSRPVWGTGDVLWEVQEGKWYGWPDYSAADAISGKEEYRVPGKDPVKPLLQKKPDTLPRPVAILGVHASANGIDFSTSPQFGYAGEAFVAEFGDMAPKVGKVMAPVGFKVVRVNVRSGIIEDFAVNRGKKNGPASWHKKGGLERPLSVRFDPAGKALYIVDFGIIKMTEKGPMPVTGTGVIWKITKEG